MPQQLSKKESAATTPMPAPKPRRAGSLVPLALTDRDDEHEVLAFLAERPVHTVVMNGYIRDNGLESPFNRGTFYACRDAEGRLQGVALIGHAMFVEARTEEALEAFAHLAQRHRATHMLLGEQDTIRRFWGHYGDAGQTPRLFCRELLFEQRWPVEAHHAVEDLRLATLDDLMLAMPVHAALAYEESGVNPLETDLAGFRLRCARRVEQGRVWILVRDGQLIFKADVISDTPDCVYIEGLYVDPLERRKGHGLACLSQMTRRLLERSGAVCALANEQNLGAQALLSKAGFRLRGYYDTVFLEQAGAE
ncbi:MAG TPA: GNAT family N-acetyltransferase [Pyrinomonadaceae bacterium]|nr:GNAT family N-acetyltransferase [Pyrinomonadaceae bacterium]